MKTSFKAALLVGASGLLSTVAAAPAFAQDAPVAAATDTGGDIIVTAQRRTERLQDVPLAISAISAQTAQQLDLRNVQSLKMILPNTDFAISSGFLALFIRGIGVPYSNPGLESSVSVYIDGAYFPRTGGVNSLLSVLDPGTIEVLRGPQGTLYGKNATGGVLRINSADATDKFEGRIAGEYGRFSHKQMEGMLNLPVTDTLAVRLAGRYLNENGFITNLYDGRKLGAANNFTLRGRFKWDASELLTIKGGIEWQQSKARSQVEKLGRGSPTCLVCDLHPVTAPGFYEANEDLDEPFFNRLFRTDLHVNLHLGEFEVSSLTAYFNNLSRQYADTDATPYPSFNFLVPRNGGTTFQQDLQVTSHIGDRFTYIAGASYIRDKRYIDIALAGTDYGVAPLDTQSYRSNSDALTTTLSVFAEGTYKLTDQIKLTAGGRYTSDKRDFDVTNGPLIIANFFGPAAYHQSAKFHAFTPRFVLAWDNGPTNIYYSYTRGFKAGGFNSPAIFQAAPIKPEKAGGHEIGMKNSLLGGKLHTNTAVFYYKNKGLQQQVTDASHGGSFVQNTGAAEGYGVEFEVNGNPMEGVNIGGAASYLHAQYKSYKNASVNCFDPTKFPTLSGCAIDLSGTVVPHAPHFTASVHGSYTFAVGDWSANVAGVGQYRSHFLFWPGAGGNVGFDQQKGYLVANFSGYVSPPSGKLRVGFYLDNAFNKRYADLRTTNQPYNLQLSPAKPRTYGARAEVTF
ncbi:TonB-dependent receptor [Rhizorhabdus argentea]|uniref:TonB-dependent receptor n=1 Tax=Rhizorhabdus argentea TaxID=1387174 RepID=UPI0030EC7636